MAKTWGMGAAPLNFHFGVVALSNVFVVCGKYGNSTGVSYITSLVAGASISISNQRLQDDASLGE